MLQNEGNQYGELFHRRNLVNGNRKNSFPPGDLANIMMSTKFTRPPNKGNETL